MRRATAVVVAILLVPAGAAAQDGLLESGRRLAAATVLQQEDSERERSVARTWIGVAMAAGGAAMAVYSSGLACADDRALREQSERAVNMRRDEQRVRCQPRGDVGRRVAALAWSDVPAARDLSVGAAPGRVSVGRRFGW